MKEHLDLLGYVVRDKVTGFAGVVTSVTFDLFGCVQALVSPMAGKDNKMPEREWFDTKRLAQVSNKQVMPAPTFEAIPGGENKPLPR